MVHLSTRFLCTLHSPAADCKYIYFPSPIPPNSQELTTRFRSHAAACLQIVSQQESRNQPTTGWSLTKQYYNFSILFRQTHTHLMALFPGLPRWAGTRKVKPMWILLKQETVSGSGISWATCKSAPHSRQITTPAPHHSVFTGRMPFLPPNQQRQSTEGKNSIKH